MLFFFFMKSNRKVVGFYKEVVILINYVNGVLERDKEWNIDLLKFFVFVCGKRG